MRIHVFIFAAGLMLTLGMAMPVVAQNSGAQQPSARQQLQNIHTPESFEQELAHLTKDLELTPAQQQVTVGDQAGVKNFSLEMPKFGNGSGTSPIGGSGKCIMRSRLGADSSRAAVYGCLGLAKMSSVRPSSTMRPRYITATRSARNRTVVKSWEMYRNEQPLAF